MHRNRNRARDGSQGKPLGGGPPYDAEAAAYFTRASITDAAAKTAINAFIAGFKSDCGIAALSERFDQLVMQGNESSAGAVVDMTGNELDQTLVNSPTFTQWRGVKTSSVSQYIDSNFNPTIGTPKFTLNAHTWGGYARAPTSGVAQNTMGSINGSFAGYQIWINDGGGNFAGSDGNTASSHYFPNPGGPQVGLLSIHRTASNSTKFLRGDSVLASAAWSPNLGLLNQNFYFLGRNHDGSLGFCTVGTELALTYIGQLSDAEMTAFSARVDTLAGALGWNV